MKISGKLSEFDILDLLNEYQSEMRKLKHKVDFVKMKIADLEAQLEVVKYKNSQQRLKKQKNESFDVSQEPFSEIEFSDEEVNSSFNINDTKDELDKETNNRKKKINKELKAERLNNKPGRKQQALSFWDKMIIDCISENGKSTISKDIFSRLKAKAIENEVFESDEKVGIKLNQCLVKLTSKRKEIIKIAYPGRGYAYALQSWLDPKGKLPKVYKL